jgi:hypothetical protein
LFGFKGNYRLLFSWSRLLAMSGAKNSVAIKTSIPTTRGGIERKIGRKIIKTFG